MERKNLAALHVVKTIPQGLCQRFHAGRPTRAPAPGCHRPVPRLQAGFHEQVDLRSRELCHRLAVRVDLMGTIKKLFYGRGTKRKGEAHEWLVDSGDNCHLVLASGIHFA